MKLGALITRTVIGGLFVGHGTQKLFGWFGGHGPEGTGQFFEMLGMRPGRRNAMAAGAAEAGGGLLFALGVFTPAAAAALTSVMITAIRTAHRDKGPWVTEGGYEYNLVLLAAIFAVTEEEHGPAWAFGQLAAGAAGSVLVTELAKREGAPQEAASPEGARAAAEVETAEQAEAPAGSTS